MHSKRASKGTKEEEATWRAYDVTDHRTTKTTTSKKNGGSKRGGLSTAFLFYTAESTHSMMSQI